jgi:ribose 5-phosphate isomerase
VEYEVCHDYEKAQRGLVRVDHPSACTQAAHKAVEYIKSDMVVGLGTGSTAAFAVDRIGQLLKDGTLKNIIGVPTSIRTLEQAKALGIPLATLDEQPHINVAIDGADEVDSNLDVVKGRGGALLREKMVELAADTFVCIVDDSKMVAGLGGSKLAMPVEIVQVGSSSVVCNFTSQTHSHTHTHTHTHTRTQHRHTSTYTQVKIHKQTQVHA